MNQMRALWPFVIRYRTRFLVGLLASIIATGFAVQVPQMLRTIVDDINTRGIIWDALVANVLIMIGFSVTDGLFRFGQRILILGTAHQVENDIREAMFLRLLQLDQKFYGDHHTGDLMTRVTNDISAIRQFYGPGVSSMASAIFMIVTSSALMMSTNATLASIVLLLLPVVTVLFIVVGARMRLIFRKVQDLFGEVSSRAQENFSGIRTIKAYTQEEPETVEFHRVNERFRAQNVRYVLLSGLLWPTISLVMGTIGALVLYIGGRAVAAGEMTVGDLVLFNGYLAALGWPVVALGWTVDLYQQAASAAGRLGEVLQRTPLIRDESTQPLTLDVDGAVSFRNVGIAVGDGAQRRWILRDITFDITKGQTVAIVGATGGGKTTLVNLLSRVQDPTTGTVHIDGHDIRSIALASLRAGIGYVPQDTFLFSVPVRDNVTFGRPDASEEDVQQALLISRLSNDVVQLPSGIDTLVGERGVTLSGGQKQRTAIARAVLRNPSILVLDDALSSVDTHTAAQILEGLRTFRAGRTAILIAQRIATVREADQIIVLHEGTIVEKGTHTELVALGGRYAAMYQREQLADAVDNA
jgi:ATP-binding cassette subfamily B protein